MPLALILTFGITFSALWQAKVKTNVLAYATSMSSNGLLSATNQQRTSNGKAALALNSKLSSAAQAKANDMVAKDYWSHNTPSGDPPWVFISSAGYDYKAAGENLAYGYLDSAGTVDGWMDSPGHKANILNSTFTEVGFGYKNSANFNGDGHQTVVVAMYATPRVLSSNTSPSSPSGGGSTTTSTATSPTTKSSKPSAKVVEESPQKAPNPTAYTDINKSDGIIAGPTVKITRFAALTGGRYTWVASAVAITIALSILALLVRHSYSLHRLITRGERYVLQHVVFDITIVSLMGLCLIISQAAGYVL